MFDAKLYKEAFSAVCAPEDTIERVYMNDRRRKAKAPRMLLVAAILVPLFILSAFAIGYGAMHAHKTAAGETMTGRAPGINVETGTAESQEIEHSGASMLFTFDVGEDCREVSVCPGWLPENDAQAENYLDRYTGGRIIDNEGERIAYCIESFNGERLRGMKYFLTGESRVMKEDVWNGYDRMEIETSYESFATGERWTAYNLLLFSPEYGYLIRIGGHADAGTDMAMLEKIAENLSVEVSAEKAQWPYRGMADISCLDIARG